MSVGSLVRYARSATASASGTRLQRTETVLTSHRDAGFLLSNFGAIYLLFSLVNFLRVV